MRYRIFAAVLSAVVLLTFRQSVSTVEAEKTENEKFSASCFQRTVSPAFDESEINLPEKFDLREKGLVSSVKNQRPYGTCWAFSSSAVLESSLIKDFPSVDLSELHLSYFSFFGDETPDRPGGSSDLVSGGHIAFAASSFARWTGPVNEEVLPYTTAGDEIDHSLKNRNDYFVSDIYALNQYSLAKIYPNEQLSFSDTEIKNMICEGNAVSVNIRYENNYNEKTFALYDSSKGMTNHAVTLVGWDDSFSRENFLVTPPGDGAWLVKNSWGNSWGDNGYFWISYYDCSLSDACCIKAEMKNRYQRNYQHDTLMYSAAISADSSDRFSGYMANIFTAEDDELITAAGLYTTDNNAEYEISVYTQLKDEDNPVSGVKSTTTYGSERYAGYHTIELDEAVPVRKGEKFAVVARLTNPEYFCPIPAEASVILCENRFPSNVSDISKSKIEQCTSAGESFISYNGTKWTDTKGMVIENAYENILFPNTNIKYYIGNVCLKAFSSKPDTVFFDPPNENVKLGTEVKLSTYSDGIIRYTTDGSIPDKDSPVYSSPVKIEKDTVITAALFSDSVSSEPVSVCYKQDSSVLTSLTVNNSPVTVFSDGQSVNKLKAYVTDTKDYACISPVSTGKISINSMEIVSGQSTEKTELKPGDNIFRIVCSEEGKKNTEYELNIFKSYACVDYHSETILFDEEYASVTAADGHSFRNGDSVSGYLGETLTVVHEGNTYSLSVAGRPDLNALLERLSIQYGAESLSQIFNVSGDMYFSFSPDMSDPHSINERMTTVLSENYFKIYPDYDKDLYFQTAASDTAPQSNIFHISIPERRNVKDDDVKITLDDENSVSVTIENAVSKGAVYKMEIKNSASNQYSTYIPLTTNFKNDTVTIENLIPGKTYSLYIQYRSSADAFCSYVKEFTVDIPGENEICTFNYEKECIIFDDSVYQGVSEDGREIKCYDVITEFIGTDITLTDSKGEKITVHIPERPAAPETEADLLNGRLTGTFDSNISFLRKRYSNNYYYTASSARNLSDSNGIIWFEKMYSSSITGGDTLLFFYNATDEAFASEKCLVIVPKAEVISRKAIQVLNYTDSSVSLRAGDGLEYGIRGEFYQSFSWQDNPVFTGLKSDTTYIVAVRFRSTPEKASSTYTCQLVTTLKNEYIPGDMNDDEKITLNDIVILKRFMLSDLKTDAQQKRAADCNGDGTVNIIDYLKLCRSIL